MKNECARLLSNHREQHDAILRCEDTLALRLTLQSAAYLVDEGIIIGCKHVPLISFDVLILDCPPFIFRLPRIEQIIIRFISNLFYDRNQLFLHILFFSKSLSSLK